MQRFKKVLRNLLDRLNVQHQILPGFQKFGKIIIKDVRFSVSIDIRPQKRAKTVTTCRHIYVLQNLPKMLLRPRLCPGPRLGRLLTELPQTH